jgi:hypothetical protein
VKVEQRLALPEPLKDVFFDFLWDTQQVWSLPTEASTVAFDQLAWLLELPVWTTVPGEPRFDLTPRHVLEDPARFPARWQRILAVELKYPLEMFRSGEDGEGRWVILDGYHRLARHQVEETHDVPVRLHPEHYKSRIMRSNKRGNET